MSTDTETTTPVAPATPAGAAPAAAPAVADAKKPAGPVSRQEAQQVARDLAAKAIPAKTDPVVDPATPPAKVDAPAAAPAEPGKEPVAPTVIKVDLPATHPAARGAQGRAIAVTTEEDAQAVRTLINSAVTRPKDLERANGEITRLQEQNRELQEKVLRTEAGQSATQKWEASPEGQTARKEFFRLKELEADGTIPPGAASRYWKGAVQDFKGVEDQEFNERKGKIDAAEEARNYAMFERNEYEHILDPQTSWLPAPIVSHPDFQRWFKGAVKQFDAALKDGLYPEIQPGEHDKLHAAFTRKLTSHLLEQPGFQAAMTSIKNAEQKQTQGAADQAAQKERERKEIEEAAVRRHMDDLAAKRTAAPPNPLAGVVAASVDRAPPGGPTAPVRAAGQTPAQVKEAARLSAQEAARRHFQR